MHSLSSFHQCLDLRQRSESKSWTVQLLIHWAQSDNYLPAANSICRKLKESARSQLANLQLIWRSRRESKNSISSIRIRIWTELGQTVYPCLTKSHATSLCKRQKNPKRAQLLCQAHLSRSWISSSLTNHCLAVDLRNFEKAPRPKLESIQKFRWRRIKSCPAVPKIK